MTPYFSIIVPVYKVEPYLRQCVDSILAQTFADFELILVDDGSPDGCPAICDEYAAKDGRVRVIHQANAGRVTVRKTGLLAARADYVCFVDGDDYVAAGWLETIHARAEESGRPDMLLFGLIHNYGSRLEESVLPLVPGYYDKERLQRELYPCMLYDGSKPFFHKAIPGWICTKIGKKDLILAHYVEDDRIIMLEDSVMVFEWLYCARSVYICAECLYYYRRHETSAMTGYYPNFISNLTRCLDYFRSHLGTIAPEMDTQINAYIVMRSIDAFSREFLQKRPFGQIVRHIRREMNSTGLPKKLRLAGLPLYIQIFVLTLKCRLYAIAALATLVRMKQTHVI